MNINVKTIALFVIGLAIAFVLVGSVVAQNKKQAKERATRVYPVTKTAAEWKKILTPEQFHVLREEGTERAGTSKLLNNHEKGTFVCAACALPLFSSDTKFESGTGWPSFFKPINDKAIIDHTDNTFGMSRTENVCARCGGHLGHVFNDGPKPTGLRYCMNGVALKFIPAKTVGAVK